MNRLIILLAIVASAVVVCGVDTGAQQTKIRNGNSLSKAFQGARPIDKNTLSIAGDPSRRKQKKTDDILSGLKDEDIFLNINGSDILKWGLLKRHLDILCSNVNRSEMLVTGNEALRKIAFRSRCKKLVKDYIEHGVFAVEARRLGITVAENEFKEHRKKARDGYSRMGKVGEELIKLIDSGESFYEHNLTNALYWKAYREKVVLPEIKVEESDVRDLVALRHTKNLEALSTNNFKKVQIVDILQKVKGGMDFGEAAEKWSDCDSAETKGVMMDDNDETRVKFEEEDLVEDLRKGCWKLKEGELSDVLETPYAWHIVKLLKRNPATDEDHETIEIAQIRIDKEFIGPEYSEAEARDRLIKVMVRDRMRAKFIELMKTIPIDCKIPLKDEENPKGRGMTIKRIK